MLVVLILGRQGIGILLGSSEGKGASKRGPDQQAVVEAREIPEADLCISQSCQGLVAVVGVAIGRIIGAAV